MSRTDQHSLVIGDYLLLEKLGSGSFASVYRCEHSMTHQKFAGKLYDFNCVPTASIHQMIRKEISILRVLHNPRIIRFREAVYSKENALVVMELVEGRTLLNMMPSNGGVPEPFARDVFIQIVEALMFLHWKGIVHRDIKLENVMIQQNGAIKLIDFGLAECIPKLARKNGLLIKNQCGSLHYYAPEMILATNQESFQGDKVDIWAAGVLLYALVSGQLPFGSVNESEEDLCHQIVNYQLGSDNKFSKELMHLLRMLLRKNPAHRPSLREINNHPWTNGTKFKNLGDPLTRARQFVSSSFRDKGSQNSSSYFPCLLNLPQSKSRSERKENNAGFPSKEKIKCRSLRKAVDKVERALIHAGPTREQSLTSLLPPLYDYKSQKAGAHCCFSWVEMKNQLRKVLATKKKSSGAKAENLNGGSRDKDLRSPASEKYRLFQDSLDEFDSEDKKDNEATSENLFFKFSFRCWGNL